MSKSPSLRRIQADVRELALDPSDRYYAAPLENDMFEWHFTIRGADGTDFEGGVYHGRILLPPEYPFKPPHIVFLTPSGRFDIHQKVCLSFSAFHPELWQPAWGIRLILEALISFLPTPADGAIGALDWTSAERKILAAKSVDFYCPTCGLVINLLPKLQPKTLSLSGDNNNDNDNGDSSTTKASTTSTTTPRFAKEIQELQRLQMEREGIKVVVVDEKTKESAAEDKETTVDGEVTMNTTSATTTSEEENAAVVATGETTKTTTEEEDQKSSNEQETTSTTTTTTSSNVPSLIDSPNRQEEEKKTETTNNETSTNNDPVVIDVQETTPLIQQPQPPQAVLDVDPLVPQQQPQQQQQQQVNAAMHADPSWMIDPLLQFMIVLLAVIIYLLLHKFQSLQTELDDLVYG